MYAEIIAAINGLLAAIAVWQAERDYRLAQAAYEREFARTLVDPETEKRATRLSGVLPERVARNFRKNIEKCWDQFGKCIQGKMDPEELRDCESANRACICGNLKSLLRSNGCLPQDLEPLWIQFDCGPQPPIC